MSARSFVRQFAREWAHMLGRGAMLIVVIGATAVGGTGIILAPMFTGVYVEHGYWPWDVVMGDAKGEIATAWYIATGVWMVLLLTAISAAQRVKEDSR